MKTKIIFIFLTINSFFLEAQTVVFIPEKINNVLIIYDVYDYNYTNDRYSLYSPDNIFFENVLTTAQSRYDRNAHILSIEYRKLMDLKLINQENLSQLERFKNEVKTQATNWVNIDLGVTSEGLNNFSKIMNYLGQIYDNPNIKAEIKLIKSCNVELNRIKINDPDNFIYSKRYKTILEVLKKLENCNLNDIKNLSWEARELELYEIENANNISHKNKITIDDLVFIGKNKQGQKKYQDPVDKSIYTCVGHTKTGKRIYSYYWELKKCFIKITFNYRQDGELIMDVIDRKEDGLPISLSMNGNW